MRNSIVAKALVYVALALWMLIPGWTLAGPTFTDESLKCCSFGEDCYPPGGNSLSMSKAFFSDNDNIMRCCRAPSGEGPCGPGKPNYCKVAPDCF